MQNKLQQKNLGLPHVLFHYCAKFTSPSLSLSLARNCKRKNVNLSRASPNIILCLPAVNQTKQKNNSNHKKHQNKHEHVSSKLVQVIAQ